MIRLSNFVISIVGTACIMAGSSASASNHSPRSRILLAQFGTVAAASNSEAVYTTSLSSQLEAQFSELVSNSGADTNRAATSEVSFMRIPGLRVPAWMRTRTNAASIALAGSEQSISGKCAPRPYMPSRLLGDSAEERRRILYPLVQTAACEAGLPIGLMDAMLIQESRYNPLAISPKGAFGLGQLMAGTATQLGVNRYDLRGNLAGAARYLRQHIDEFRQVPLALAAYNAGPGRVRKAWSIPRITETQNYVRQILTNWRSLELDAAPIVGPQGSETRRRSTLVSSFP